MLALLLSATLALAAQDAAPDAAALQTELETLEAEFDAYSESFWASLPRDESGALTLPTDQADKLPDKVFASRFLDLGRRAGATPAGALALTSALGKVKDVEERREVADLLVTRFLDSPLLEQAIASLGRQRYSLGSAPVAALLRRVIDGSPHDGVQAAATFALAQVLMDPEYTVGPAGTQSVGAADTAAARALLEALQQRHADSQHAADARGFLFELDHLQVGMVAPDIEAVDQDGVPFRLSDSRGKVVLLVFWGFW